MSDDGAATQARKYSGRSNHSRVTIRAGQSDGTEWLRKRGRPRTIKGTNDVGAKIRLRRTELQIAQKELSRRVGVSLPQVNRYEKGSDDIAASRLQQLAKALEVPVAFFFNDRNDGRATASALILDTPNKARLARAFSQIQNERVRLELVRLVEVLTQQLPAKRQRRTPI